jgi:polyhydroxyalkanoate synthesis repressor PhaR
MAAPRPKPTLQIRKYSNRRLYDTTRSRHLTADELYELVRAGHDVVVTDSTSGSDITHQVLTQMILERDSPKLAAFPATLLHEIIRANQQMWRKFAEEWMAGLSTAISQQADAYAKKVADFGRRSLDASRLGRLIAGAIESLPAARDEKPPPSAEDLPRTVRRLEGEVKKLASAVAGRSRKRRRPRRP